MRKSRRYTEQERAEARARQREQVERSVRELLTSDGWRRWAETRSTFHRYSMGNCMLIAMQAPEATQVAGFRKWQELGRQVRKGERSIKILAPMSVKERDEAGEETGERVTFFRSVPVFDIAQTDGEPLPEAPREPITGDSHARYLEPLKELARSMGLAVYEYEPTSAAPGFYDEKGRRIVISDRARAERQGSHAGARARARSRRDLQGIQPRRSGGDRRDRGHDRMRIVGP